MKKYNLFSLLIAFVVVGFNASAQDSKAKTILDKLSKKTASYTSMKADFEYVMQNKSEDIEESQEGSILSKGEKYNLEIAGQKIISDGKTVWTILDEAEEVQINNVPEEDETEDYISPTKILKLWEQGFNYKFDKTEMLKDSKVDVINLYPEKADEKSFHTIKLYIDQLKTIVSQIVIKGKDGTDYIYKIKSFQTNETINDSEFVFSTSKNPSYDVIDLR